MFKFKEDSIFTKIGRARRKIAKSEKTIKECDEIIERCNKLRKHLDMTLSYKEDNEIENSCDVKKDNESQTESKDVQKTDLNKNDSTNNDSIHSKDNNTNLKIITVKSKNKPKIVKSSNIKLIQDKNIKLAVDIFQAEENIDDTIELFKKNNIELEKDQDCYITKNNSIGINVDENNKILTTLVRTKLMYVPHGDLIKLYNKIADELKLQRISNDFDDIGLDGKACIIKSNKGSAIACNMHIINNELLITFVYGIEK